MSVPSVGIITLPGINSFLFSIPQSIFSLQLPGKLFDVQIASIDDMSVNIDASMAIAPTIPFSRVEAMDIIVIPGWPALEYCPDSEVQHMLRCAYARGAIIIGLCFGSYALAYSGLLDGKMATTHWLAENDFKTRFPEVELNANSLYVEDERIITSAGSSSGIDCCIYVINKIYGYRLANDAARMMVSCPYREGGQAQFINHYIKNPEEPAINAIIEFLKANIKVNYTLDDLAKRFSMSKRTLIRRFEISTGMSIKKWVNSMRLKIACELLESGSLSIERISEEAGFGNANLFRHHFANQYHISPQVWRKRFFNRERCLRE